MQDIDLFPDEDLSQYRNKQGEHVRKGSLTIQYLRWYVVGLKPIGQISNSNSLLTVSGCYDYDFVTKILQTLCHIENMHFYATKVWDEKVRDNRNSQLLK